MNEVKLCIEVKAQKQHVDSILYIANTKLQALRELDELIAVAKERKMSIDVINKLSTDRSFIEKDLRNHVATFIDERATILSVKICSEPQ